MKILITGFDPFGGEKLNPATEAVKLLPASIAGAEIAKLELPTVFEKCAFVAAAAIESLRPDAVLAVGQAGGRFDVTVERVAINLADGSIPDNAGMKPVDEAVRPEGPVAYFSTLPTRAMVERIRGRGIPASLSYSAGSYVCNYLLYSLLHEAEARRAEASPGPAFLAGFIHIPYLPAQVAGKPGANTPSMSLADSCSALEAAIEAIAECGGPGASAACPAYLSGTQYSHQ
jgi:pyroglutamyl-peptidase